ncbi:hypothetical protein CEY16_09360 [Halalkalibacillus sediminis]|uniref:3D domain-containing protein n=2 Tax=Halalkalibacillus sediminis TaxID=2018042 RepID=A0A2I0QVQ5_9BACI|nr:hypothetical protein CEY16_09360 [Halalkalibacillus sediminis]
MTQSSEADQQKPGQSVNSHQSELENKADIYIQHEEVKDAEHANIELASTKSEDAFKRYPTQVVVATGYTAGYESTGKTEGHPQYGITFSGLKVQRDEISTIAADLSTFPLGTVLYIPEYGYGIVTDIGGAIKGNKIDLYYDTVDEVFNEWGKRELEVYVIEQGDGTVNQEDLEVWKKKIEDRVVPVMSNE